MPHQNAGAGDSILVMIALVAMVVFIPMLFASFVIVHPKGRTESQAGPKKEHRSSLAAAVRARLFSPYRPKRELTACQSAILASLKTRCGAETPSSDLRFSRRVDRFDRKQCAVISQANDKMTNGINAKRISKAEKWSVN